VFTARYALSRYIKQIRFVFKGLMFVIYLSGTVWCVAVRPFALSIQTDRKTSAIPNTSLWNANSISTISAFNNITYITLLFYLSSLVPSEDGLGQHESKYASATAFLIITFCVYRLFIGKCWFIQTLALIVKSELHSVSLLYRTVLFFRDVAVLGGKTGFVSFTFIKQYRWSSDIPLHISVVKYNYRHVTVSNGAICICCNWINSPVFQDSERTLRSAEPVLILYGGACHWRVHYLGCTHMKLYPWLW
jgi:hypothetical protein